MQIKITRTLGALLLILLTTACFYTSVNLNPNLFGGSNELREKELFNDGETGEGCACLFPFWSPTPPPKVLLIPITGVIGTGSFFSRGEVISPSIVQRILDRAEDDSTIQALILKIDSPGGTVTGSDQIYELIRRFAKKKKLPVYAHIDGIGASGGYYIAVAAPHINAGPTSLVGSIGVILSGFNIKGLLEKLGIRRRAIASGPNKSIFSPYRDLTPEQTEHLRKQILTNYERFLRKILSTRANRLKEKELRAAADGNVYDANRARELKLIDSVSYFRDYIDYIKKDRKFKHVRITAYLPEGTSAENLFDARTPVRPGGNIIERMLGTDAAGLLYLWQGIRK